MAKRMNADNVAGVAEQSTELSTTLAQELADDTCRALTLMQLDIAKGGNECTVVCSYDPSTKDGAIRRERAECDAQDNGIAFINKKLDIVAFTVTRTELADEQGEFHSVPILCLEMADGTLVNLFSAPALRCFTSRLRVHLFDGPLSAKHPLSLILTQRATSGARKMYWLERP